MAHLRSLVTSTILMIGWGSAAAPPPNDNFADRIVLQGNWLTFTGTLAGATREEPCFPSLVYPLIHGNGDVWWSWTAGDSLPVTLMVERLSFLPASFFGPDSIAVALFPGASSNNTCGASVVATMPLQLADTMATMTFAATAGTTYQIVLGSNTNDFRIRLMATNAPIVVEQPRSLTVSPGAGTLLTVIAAGVRPFAYQWRFNGNDLSGETGPMLALTNVSGTNAGGYSVLISNVTGTVSSDTANLTVNEVEVPSELRPLRSTAANRFEFELFGEAGRFYQVESSTNLVSWQPEKTFVDPRPAFAPYFVTSVLFQSNASSLVSIPAGSPHKFYRAVRYAPADERCHLFLKQIRFAKELWARDYHKEGGDVAGGLDLAPYFKNQPVYFACPTSGGFHWAMAVISVPQCTTPRAVLEEPR